MIVVDTNVIAYLMIPGERSSAARDVLRSDLSAYDAEFVALSRALETRLVTCDEGILAQVSDRAVGMEEFVGR